MADLKTTVTIDVNEGEALADIKRVQTELAATETQAARTRAMVTGTRATLGRGDLSGPDLIDAPPMITPLGDRLARLQEQRGINNLASRFNGGGIFRRTMGAAGLGQLARYSRFAAGAGAAVHGINATFEAGSDAMRGNDFASSFAYRLVVSPVASGIAGASNFVVGAANVAEGLLGVELITETEERNVQRALASGLVKLKDAFLPADAKKELEAIAKKAGEDAARVYMENQSANEMTLLDWGLPMNQTLDLRMDLERLARKRRAEEEERVKAEKESDRAIGRGIGEGE